MLESNVSDCACALQAVVVDFLAGDSVKSIDVVGVVFGGVLRTALVLWGGGGGGGPLRSVPAAAAATAVSMTRAASSQSMQHTSNSSLVWLLDDDDDDDNGGGGGDCRRTNDELGGCASCATTPNVSSPQRSIVGSQQLACWLFRFERSFGGAKEDGARGSEARIVVVVPQWWWWWLGCCCASVKLETSCPSLESSERSMVVVSFGWFRLERSW
jgi:hypothetical protein